MDDGARLNALFAGVQNRKQWARDHQFPGGDAMVYQHITGRRHISLDAAAIYCRAFGVRLSEISPRLARLVDQLAYSPGVQEPRAPFNVLQLREDANIAAVAKLMRDTDDEGRIRAKMAVEFALKDHKPRAVKKAAK